MVPASTVEEKYRDAVVVVTRPLCPHLQWVACAPLTFCFSYAAVLYLAGCLSMLLGLLGSLGSQLLIREKAPSRTKSMSRHLTRLSCWSEKHRRRAPAESNNDTSPYRPPISVQKKKKSNNKIDLGLEDLSICCRGSPSGGVKALLSLCLH